MFHRVGSNPASSEFFLFLNIQRNIWSSRVTVLSLLSTVNGLLNTFYNVWLPGGLCGQYVCPKSSRFSCPILSQSPSHSLHSSIVLLACCICPGKMLVILRDGRKLHGVLRSYDQFGQSFLVCRSERMLKIRPQPTLCLKIPLSEYTTGMPLQRAGTVCSSSGVRMSSCSEKSCVCQITLSRHPSRPWRFFFPV